MWPARAGPRCAARAGPSAADHDPARVAGVAADRALREETHRLREQAVLQRTQLRVHRGGVARVGYVERGLEDDWAAVDAVVDEVHGDAEDLDPVLDGLSDRPVPRALGQQRGR